MFKHDKPLYIVAGGASLAGFPFDWLADKQHIAINAAGYNCPHATALWWADGGFYNSHRDMIEGHAAPLKATFPCPHFRHDYSGFTVFAPAGLSGLCMNPGSLSTGNNSGHAAINLAVQLGARNLVLLGYDMRRLDDKSHWHDHYQVVARERTYAEKMLPYLATLKNPLAVMGVSVLNASIHSAIDWWPKCDWKELVG